MKREIVQSECCYCGRMMRSADFQGVEVWFGADDPSDTFCEANPHHWHEPYVSEDIDGH